LINIFLGKYNDTLPWDTCDLICVNGHASSYFRPQLHGWVQVGAFNEGGMSSRSKIGWGCMVTSLANTILDSCLPACLGDATIHLHLFRMPGDTWKGNEHDFDRKLAWNQDAWGRTTVEGCVSFVLDAFLYVWMHITHGSILHVFLFFFCLQLSFNYKLGRMLMADTHINH